MRALFVASPLVGHVLPLVPLAQALRDAGHDVVLATGADGLGAGRSAGLDTRDVAPGIDLRKAFVGVALRHPVLAARELKGRAGTDMVGRLFATVFEQMADGVVALADEWRPDLVVHEPLAATGALVAARRGVPSVTVDAALFDARELQRVTTEKVGATAAGTGAGASRPPPSRWGRLPPAPS